MAKTKLYLIPYAGASATLYNRWSPYLNDNIELVPIELPGRGKRINEALLYNFNDMLQDITKKISISIKNSENTKYSIFGYSMGSLLGYELYYQLEKMNLPLPEHIFFSAREAPHLSTNEQIHTLSDEELCKKINLLGGTAKPFFESKELLNFFLPIIRADFSVIESYQFQPKLNNLACDISVLYATDDVKIEAEQIKKWKEYSDKLCRFYSFHGGHFFINNNPERIVQIINSTLL